METTSLNQSSSVQYSNVLGVKGPTLTETNSTNCTESKNLPTTLDTSTKKFSANDFHTRTATNEEMTQPEFPSPKKHEFDLGQMDVGEINEMNIIDSKTVHVETIIIEEPVFESDPVGLKKTTSQSELLPEAIKNPADITVEQSNQELLVKKYLKKHIKNWGQLKKNQISLKK